MAGTVSATGVVVREPREGPATWAMGSLFGHLVGPAHTEGLRGGSLLSQPPGVAPSLHQHAHEAEAFFVLSGQVSY